MDNVDRELINLLQKNARTPLKSLASKVYLSAPAVSSRIDKLERQGIITRYNTSVDARKLGFNTTAYIDMTVSEKEQDEFYSFINECPNVLECNFISGGNSIMMKVIFQDETELNGYLNELQRFGDATSHVVFSTLIPQREVRLV